MKDSIDEALSKRVNVAVLGAAGGIGQPLSLQLKLHPLCGSLHIYDIANIPGVAADLSHISTKCTVKGFVGKDQLLDSLAERELVIITAGFSTLPGQTLKSREDFFEANAAVIKELMQAVAQACPSAWVCIVTTPINSLVPMAAQVMKAYGVYNPNKLFGVNAVDIVRAKTFWGELTGTNPEHVTVPLIGGHDDITILPLLSQASPPYDADEETLKALMTRIQNAGFEVVQAKEGKGSATLSTAFALAELAGSCMKAMVGEPDVIESVYVESKLVSGLDYFASPVRLGSQGVTEFLPLGDTNKLEQNNLAAMKPLLQSQIKVGIDYINNEAAT